jgi:hypothetical protein
MYFLSLRKDDNHYFNPADKTQTRLIGPLTLSESFDVMDAIKKQIIEDIKITNDLTDEKEITIEESIEWDWMMIAIGIGDEYYYIIRTEAEKYSELVIKDFLR